RGDYERRAVYASLLLRSCDRRVGEDLVLLHARLVLVGLVYVLDRAFRDQRARHDHDANEAAGRIGGDVREHRVGPGLVPGAARSVRRRAAVGVDADAALEETADAGPLIAVQIGALPRREA